MVCTSLLYRLQLNQGPFMAILNEIMGARAHVCVCVCFLSEVKRVDLIGQVLRARRYNLLELSAGH